MKKLIAGVFALSLMGSSVAFAADTAAHSKLSAFQNVKISTVSADDMNKVSGEGFINLNTLSTVSRNLLPVRIGLLWLASAPPSANGDLNPNSFGNATYGTARFGK